MAETDHGTSERRSPVGFYLAVLVAVLALLYGVGVALSIGWDSAMNRNPAARGCNGVQKELCTAESKALREGYLDVVNGVLAIDLGVIGIVSFGGFLLIGHEAHKHHPGEWFDDVRLAITAAVMIVFVAAHGLYLFFQVTPGPFGQTLSGNLFALTTTVVAFFFTSKAIEQVANRQQRVREDSSSSEAGTQSEG